MKEIVEDEMYTNGEIAVHVVSVGAGRVYCKLHGGMRCAFSLQYFASAFRPVWERK